MNWVFASVQLVPLSSYMLDSVYTVHFGLFFLHSPIFVAADSISPNRQMPFSAGSSPPQFPLISHLKKSSMQSQFENDWDEHIVFDLFDPQILPWSRYIKHNGRT